MSSLRILIVDDDRDAADSLAELLSVMGHEAQKAYDGPTALVLAADFQPALILLDLCMPYMSGFEVARKLRAMGAPFTIAAITGHGQQADVDRCLKEGFDHHILKPAAPSDIQTLIDSVDCPADSQYPSRSP